MRQLLELIRQFKNVLLFLILEGLSFYFISKTSSIQGLEVVSSANATAAWWYKKEHDVLAYFHLKSVNDSLLAQNATLQQELAAYSNTDTFRNRVHTIPQWALIKPDTANDSNNVIVGTPKIVAYAQYTYIPARVINAQIYNDRNNFITIDRGAADGIKKDMAVVTYNGIVGTVVNVSAHYATVITLLSDRKFSAMLIDGTAGMLSWTPGPPELVTMEQVPIDAKPRRLDMVYTSAYSIVFPKGIPIGRIVKIDTMRVNNTLNLKIKLNTNFRKLPFVYIVKDFTKEEKAMLNSKTQKQVQNEGKPVNFTH